jgi:flagellar motor component MotA
MTGMPKVGYGSFLVDLPTTLLTIIFLFFFFFISKSGSIIGRYIKSSFKKNYTYTKTELESLSCAIKNTVKFTIATGGFGFLTGVIASLIHLENRNMLGPNLAVSLFSVFYSITVSYIIFFPVQAWAENEINTMANDT